jgi:hypothetical protein
MPLIHHNLVPLNKGCVMEVQECPKCNASLFSAIPLQTTQAAIVEFARSSSLSNKESIVRSRWLHPGRYCPNGCYRELWEYESSSLLPKLSLFDELDVVKEYSARYLSEFTATQGQNSRCLACAQCKKFDGASVEGRQPTSFFRNPELKPLRDHRIVQARCIDPRIQVLARAWWYDQDNGKLKCEYFEPNWRFKSLYKRVTGWSEYPK